jgi:hypothetical protein
MTSDSCWDSYFCDMSDCVREWRKIRDYWCNGMAVLKVTVKEENWPELGAGEARVERGLPLSAPYFAHPPTPHNLN